MADAHAHGPKIHVFHATAPTCFWSWGYEALFNRLQLVYGDQIGVHVMTLCVYDDYDEYLKHYELTFDGLVDWVKEGIEIMGVPLMTDLRREMFPKSVMPASLAAMAAYRQGEAMGKRFMRAVLRRFLLEGQDVTKPAILAEAAAEARLDVKTFRTDLADPESLRADYEKQGDGFPHLPVGFYNVLVTDQENRTVILDHAFDPAIVEEAIDYLSKGKLVKRTPTDIAGYLREHGAAPLSEVARVFGLTPGDAGTRLRELQKAGKVATTTLAGAPHWHPA